MSRRYDAAAALCIEAAELLYKHGIATVVTDGRYVQIEKEKKDGLSHQE
jgi:hypothetical protein